MSLTHVKFMVFVEAQLAFTCSKSTMETPEQCVKSVQSSVRSGVFIVNFEQISHIVLVFPLPTLSR